jgi:hypothetical protein
MALKAPDRLDRGAERLLRKVLAHGGDHVLPYEAHPDAGGVLARDHEHEKTGEGDDDRYRGRVLRALLLIDQRDERDRCEAVEGARGLDGAAASKTLSC